MRVSPHCTLIDTAEWSDAISTGRDREEDIDQGEDGLRMTYDGGDFPTVTFNGPDGEVRLTGAAEIFYVAARMQAAAWFACRDSGRRLAKRRQLKLHRAAFNPRLLGSFL